MKKIIFTLLACMTMLFEIFAQNFESVIIKNDTTNHVMRMNTRKLLKYFSSCTKLKPADNLPLINNRVVLTEYSQIRNVNELADTTYNQFENCEVIFDNNNSCFVIYNNNFSNGIAKKSKRRSYCYNQSETALMNWSQLLKNPSNNSKEFQIKHLDKYSFIVIKKL